MRVQPELEVHCIELSMVDRGAVLVLGSRLVCLSYSGVVCLLFIKEFSFHYPSGCSAVHCPIWYIDVTTAYTRVPVHNFTPWIIAEQWVPGYPLTPLLSTLTFILNGIECPDPSSRHPL